MDRQIFSVAEGEPPREVEAPAAHANALVKVRAAHSGELRQAAGAAAVGRLKLQNAGEGPAPPQPWRWNALCR